MPASNNPPGPCAVYRCYDAADVLLYIGQSANLRDRFRQHKSHGVHWYPMLNYVHLTWYPGRADALEKERAAIKEERPLFNDIMHDPKRAEAHGRQAQYLLDHGSPMQPWMKKYVDRSGAASACPP